MYPKKVFLKYSHVVDDFSISLISAAIAEPCITDMEEEFNLWKIGKILACIFVKAYLFKLQDDIYYSMYLSIALLSNQTYLTKYLLVRVLHLKKRNMQLRNWIIS